jgi:hypothetical protein
VRLGWVARALVPSVDTPVSELTHSVSVAPLPVSSEITNSPPRLSGLRALAWRHPGGRCGCQKRVTKCEQVVHSSRPEGSGLPSPVHIATGEETRRWASARVRHAPADVGWGRISACRCARRRREDPAACTARATIDASSYDSGNARRDRDVSSPALLDAGRFPDITFTAAGARAEHDSWIVDGSVSAHGATDTIQVRVSEARAEGDGAYFRHCPPGPDRARDQRQERNGRKERHPQHRSPDNQGLT